MRLHRAFARVLPHSNPSQRDGGVMRLTSYDVQPTWNGPGCLRSGRPPLTLTEGTR